VEVGRADGALAEVDIGERAGTFRFVRLTNRSGSCDENAPGAEIDAIAAIGSGPLQQLFQSSILFDFNRDTLRAGALPTLDALSAELQRLNPARAFVVGHADSVGSDSDNIHLSERRAAAVQGYLAERQPGADIRVSAYGEARPIAGNDTETGRERNRRVEVLIVPR
jgi:outer membrane protein OmpA-like peptidoglycan-associated protein